MAREVRITIDDDEVFERMKRRKRELDLSWEEVLHRGLWTDGRDGFAPGAGHGHAGAPGEDIGDRLERQITQRVEDSLRTAFGVDEPVGRRPPGGPAPDPGYEDEVETLANAEDATLAFPFLEDRPGNRVPLRISLETRAGSVDVDVVTVRQGKDVAELNRFERGARRRVAEELASGAPAVLELEAGVEEYHVSPALTWSRDDQGAPIVTDVEIDEVIFDADG